MNENGFWKVCEALDCRVRIELFRYLHSIERDAYPCVNELAERFGLASATISVHMKKLANVGLVLSRRADRRVYYRAFPSGPSGGRVLAALREFFARNPDEERIRKFHAYAHALSHVRRHLIVRCLAAAPGIDLKTLSARTEMPPQTADRLWGELAKARIVDLASRVVPPPEDPELMLLEMTLAPDGFSVLGKTEN